MNNIPLYTKWRPIQITDIVGQHKIVSAIKKQAEKDKFCHAYLFAGQFGSGKTSIARIISALMTCEHREGYLACGKCRSCTSIHNGYCVDVYEVDAASKRGIDDARKIKETANYAPQELKKKIYIIDECHMLTTEAWNSLLKIIEEPPSYVTFIFCTTDHRKVPSTITSRCQSFIFNQISTQEMFNHLKQIAKKEKIEIVDNVLTNIAKISRGSMRDAINHLEQIAMAKDNKIGEKEANEYFGIPDETITYEIVNLMVSQDASGLLEKVNILLQSGIEAKTILNDISYILRNIFVCKICGKDSALLDVLDVERKSIAEIAEKVNRNSLIKTASALSRIEKEINVNLNERWILEAALINCLILLKNDVSNAK
jgi:DNA polymerase-3 subunit gamma/tau